MTEAVFHVLMKMTAKAERTRACTGFDGGFEVEEAIRGPARVSTGT